MLRDDYFVLGIMSGTSLDGIDLAYIKFTKKLNWTFEVLSAQTVAYSNKWHNTLSNLSRLSVEEIAKIDVEYTAHLAAVIKAFLDGHHIENLTCISSHGHTALHQPHKGLTYQIGNLEALHQLTGITVVCNFRTADVKLGGQGAPLVPIGDRLLFSDYDFCLNLGGFSNISFEDKKQRLAFDICPVNTVLNHYSNRLGFEFDCDGALSKSGSINNSLLMQLNDIEYYKLPYPKSLGVEFVNEVVLPILESFNIDIKDKMRTFTEHIAYQIALNLNLKNDATTLVTGGGAKNTFLMNRIQDLCSGKLVVPHQLIIDYKEAIIFGLLGVLKLRNEINCLSSVTGASQDHTSGVIYS